jgi:N-acetylmuramoyl-L-alanine amidase
MKTILLDAGHGGIINGEYQTKGKRSPEYSEGVLYEGEFNRSIVNRLVALCEKNGIPYVNLTATNLDIGLDNRVDFANTLEKDYRDCVYISVHANAGGGTGFEVFTSPGPTRSDDYAEILIQEIETEFPELRLRADTKDGDHDKEAKFYVLTQTRMPSVLIECAFMDNESPDYLLLKSNEARDRFAHSIFRGIQKIVK